MTKRRRVISQQSTGGGLLPAEYQQVEYIQSPSDAGRYSGAFINTGIGGSINFGSFRIVTDIYIVGDSVIRDNFSGNLFGEAYGAPPSSDPYALWLTINPSYPNKILYSYVGNKTLFQIDFTLDNNWHHIDMSNNLHIDNVLCAENDLISYQGRASFFLFRVGSYTTSIQYNAAGVRMKRTQIYNGSPRELVRDYVPCYRKSDNVAGMYDIVNNTFKPSEGSMQFIAGPNV